MYRKLNLKKGDIIQEEHLAHIEQGIADATPMVNVTYAELVALRNEGKLIAGQKYRMTDYETTCTWENTQVAGHPFDLVLTALDNKTLDEKCSAIWSERDTDGYFAKSNLPAWDVRYCLDNDTNRFDWALLGEKGLKVSAMGQEYEAIDMGGSVVIDGTTYYIWAGIMNGEPTLPFLSKTPVPKVGDELYITMDGATISDTAQVIDSYEKEGGKGVIYRLVDELENSVPYDFKNIMFMRSLTEGKYDAENGVDTFCYTFCRIDLDTYAKEDLSVKAPYACYNNKFAVQCSNNVFLIFGIGDCYSNTFGYDCSFNTFGDNCYSNTFGYNCYSNTFGDDCSFNTFGNDCYSNTFGVNCYSNTFGDNCYSYTFGNDCYSNTFGDNCYNINFGEYCTNNTFGNSCYNINFGESPESLHDYYQFNTFNGDNHDIDFYSSEAASSTRQVQYYIFTNGAREVSLATNFVSATRYNKEATFVIGVVNAQKPRQVKLSDLV